MMLDTLRRLIQRRRVARELDDELRFHVEMETEANVARGMAPTEARRLALADFGGVVQTHEAVGDVRRFSIESLWQDVRYAARTLGSNPAFTLAAAGMLALGIGITTAMFTVVDALLLRPVPFEDPDRLAHVWMGTDNGGSSRVAPAALEAWRESPAFEAAESAVADTALLETGETIVTRGVATVTPGVFDMLGSVRQVRGRLFAPGEGGPGQRDRVIVSETLWRSLFGADPGFVGSAIIVDGERLTVVGVLPSDFRFPSSTTALWRPTDLAARPGERAQAYIRWADGIPRDDAVRLARDAARAADPANANLRPWVYPLVRESDAYSNNAVRLLAGGVVLVFLVLCANVCSLLLARLTARRCEFSMRAALGAARSRLLRQAVVESAVLGALGVALGAGVAWVLVSIARVLVPEPLLAHTLNPLDLDSRALAATSIAGLVATFAAGLLPAWLGTRVNAGESLRVVDRSGTEARGARTVSRALLVVEVALACTLLVGATLLTRSFVNLSRADRGLDTSDVITVTLSLPKAAFPDAGARQAVARTIEDGIRQLPGIQQMAWSYGLPPTGGAISFGDWNSDLPGAPAVNMIVEHIWVGPEFFSLYGIPILRGRTFQAPDDSSAVIVGERLAAALWPDIEPVGRTFRRDKQQFHVIGVARETHYPTLDAAHDRPEFYQRHDGVGSYASLSIRCADGCPAPAVVRRQVRLAHPALALHQVDALEDAYLEQQALPRASAALALTFAAIALVAAAGGLFSVLSYAVGRRRREFGIRTALGASPAQIRRVVFRDGLVVTVAGLAIGSLAAVLLARTLSALQYGVTASDPLSLLVIVATIGLTTLVASWRPARAAARVDPVRLLREE